MHTFLARAGVRLLDFKQYAVRTTEQLISRSMQEALNQHRPIPYVPNSKLDKEALARRLLQEHPLQRGLICMLRVLEPCMTFEYHRAPDPAQRGLRLKTGKCLHLYKYYLHPRFGFIGSRIQTWFPCDVQIWLNGREWLACQLQRRGGHRLHPSRQLLYPAGQPRPGPAPDGPSTHQRLEACAGCDCAQAQSAAQHIFKS